MARCSIGDTLHKKWCAEVKAAPYATWQDVFFDGRKQYEEHAKSCPDCMEVEMKRMEKYGVVLSKVTA